MGRLRRNRSFRSVASFLLLLALWGSPHRSQDDPACLPMLAGEHDVSQHALGPIGPVQHEHCAICHWQRGLRPSLRVTLLGSVVMRAGSNVVADRGFFCSDTSALPLPARAPPLTLL